MLAYADDDGVCVEGGSYKLSEGLYVGGGVTAYFLRSLPYVL